MADYRDKLFRKLRIRNQAVREGLAEFLGTTVLLLGDGSVAQYIIGGKDKYNSFLSINIAWGVAVCMGVYVAGGVSGGHINPAVTLTMAVLGKLPWLKVPVYMAGQYAGAIFGSALIYFAYHEGLDNFDGGQRITVGEKATAGIFATYPADYLTAGGGVADQIVGTALLLVCVLAITDDKNIGAPKGMIPFCVGWAVLGIGATFGMNCGYAINPARDLGPRIFTAMAGWGGEPFSFRNHNWFWVPIIGPHLGALIGGILYFFCVGNHHPEETEQAAEVKEKGKTADLEMKIKDSDSKA